MKEQSERERNTMLFRKKIERACDYCLYGTKADEDTIICSKKGMKHPEDQCWKFKYDPTKRVPGKPRALDFSKYDDQDFSL